MKLPTLRSAKPALRPLTLLIRGAMQQRGLDIYGLVAALGLEKRQHPTVRNWIAGLNGPSPEIRGKLAKVLGLTEAQLTSPLKSGTNGRPREEVRLNQLGPAQRAVVLARGQTPPTVTLVEPIRDVFSIVGRSDGQISVRLQATLDAQRGMALARFLMDFGLIIGDERESEAP